MSYTEPDNSHPSRKVKEGDYVKVDLIRGPETYQLPPQRFRLRWLLASLLGGRG